MSDSDRRRAEIAEHEQALRSGDEPMQGVLQALQDWQSELREIDRMMRKPLAIDLYCGLGGWASGFLAEGYRVVGFDIEIRPYPAQLVIQDVLTIHGSQFRDAAVIVASPPCQKYSYLAMPWSRSKSEHSQAAKALRREWEANGPDNRLFDACFRIQREAIEAAGRYIPLIVENVRGAQPWVGRSAWNYGSFHLWGDVPALMPIRASFKNTGGSWFNIGSPGQKETNRNPVHELAKGDGNGNQRNDAGDDAPRSLGRDAGAGRDEDGMPELGGILSGVGIKGRNGGGWFGDARGNINRQQDPRDVRKQPDGSWETPDGTKIGGDWVSDPQSTCRKHGSRSNARKMASAQIAKIPLPLASWIAKVYLPREATA